MCRIDLRQHTPERALGLSGCAEARSRGLFDRTTGLLHLAHWAAPVGPVAHQGSQILVIIPPSSDDLAL